MVNVINCHDIADRLLNELEQEVAAIHQATGERPRLDVILVGDNPASKVYVNNKIKRCERVGIESKLWRFDESVTADDLLALISELNNTVDCHGLMVQLPLPKHLNEDEILEAIHWAKDVDGLTSTNQARLLNNHPMRLDPCTPLAVMEILKTQLDSVQGSDVTVIGRSRLFGSPMALMLRNANATVTMCHSRSDLTGPLKNAEIVISAVGLPKYFKADQFGSQQIIVDVGINRDEAGKLCGDIDFASFEQAFEKCPRITPVPGGVGVLTTTLLMSNTVKAYHLQNKKD